MSADLHQLTAGEGLHLLHEGRPICGAIVDDDISLRSLAGDDEHVRQPVSAGTNVLGEQVRAYRVTSDVPPTLDGNEGDLYVNT